MGDGDGDERSGEKSKKDGGELFPGLTRRDWEAEALSQSAVRGQARKKVPGGGLGEQPAGVVQRVVVQWVMGVFVLYTRTEEVPSRFCPCVWVDQDW